MKNYTDEEIKMMAGHPDCFSSIEINGFLRGFRRAEKEYNSLLLEYSLEPPFLPYMYSHLREEMIFNHNFDEIDNFSKKCKLSKFDSTDGDLFYPPLIFEYMYPLGAAHYDFEIKNAKFKKCWVEPFDSTDGVIRYKTGSYYVIFEK